MTLTVHGHRVRTERVDGLRDHWRVFADGVFCGLIECDCGGYHTVPRTLVGVVSPPTLRAPTVALALSSLLAETIDN